MADTIALMRKRVLDMAIRGELVEQRSEEGTADSLVAPSKESRATMTNSPILPNSWEWAMLSEVADIIMGQSPPGKSVSIENEGIEFHQGKIYFGEMYLKESDQKTDNPKKIVDRDTLLLSVRAPVGNLNITQRRISIGRGLCGIKGKNGIKTKFLYYFLTTAKETMENKATGTTFKAISGSVIRDLSIPLPPLGEQKRIVTKIEEIFAVIDQIGTKKEEALSIIRNMRQSALQDAIMGVLVEQDENDEPASILYEKIQAEKERLIKEKKIKKEKPLPAIEEDEIPFEIPDSWKWVRLGNVILSIFGGGTPSKAITSYWNGDIPWATVKDISDKDTQLNSTIDFITEDGFNNCSGQMVNKGDIIVITRMGLGRAVISCIDTAINQDLKGIKLPKQLNSKYFLNAYKSIDIKGTGTTVKGIKQSSLLNACIPLPPLKEQERIAEKIDEIMAICDQMEAIFDGTSEVSEDLKVV